MNDAPPQSLDELFPSIISMVLAVIRARGWRCVKDLPRLLLVLILLRRMGKQFAAMLAEFRAGKLCAPEPALATVPVGQEAACAQLPAAGTAPPEQEAARAQAVAPAGPGARTDAEERARRRPAVRRAVAADAAGADCARAEAAPAMRVRVVARAGDRRPLLEGIAGVAAAISEKVGWGLGDTCGHFVTR